MIQNCVRQITNNQQKQKIAQKSKQLNHNCLNSHTNQVILSRVK